nr:hypothetical protein GCM10020093_022910 [Planobispora longispora]
MPRNGPAGHPMRLSGGPAATRRAAGSQREGGLRRTPLDRRRPESGPGRLHQWRPGLGLDPLTGYLADMFRDRDVVVLEQRGSRWSQPRLDCPETVRAVLDTLVTPGRARQERA